MVDLSENVFQPQGPQGINFDEVLSDLGLDNFQEGGTVIQNNDSTVAIPVVNNVNTTFDSATPEDVDIIAEELAPPPVKFEPIPVTTDSVASGLPTTEKLDIKKAVKILEQRLTPNSNYYKVDDTTSRFSGAAWFYAVQKSSVLLAGLGGIGSWVALILSRMKPRQLILYDDDIVERVNLSGQLYSTNHIGLKKANATAKIASEFSEYHSILAIPEKFTEATATSDIMICGFDNMAARKTFFKSWTNHLLATDHPENCLFIDARLDMEEFQVFCIKGNDIYHIKKYEDEYLFADWQAESVACSVKQTTYCANMIGSIVVNLFTNFISNTLNPVIERDLPFKTYYNASMMYLKTEIV